RGLDGPALAGNQIETTARDKAKTVPTVDVRPVDLVYARNAGIFCGPSGSSDQACREAASGLHVGTQALPSGAAAANFLGTTHRREAFHRSSPRVWNGGTVETTHSHQLPQSQALGAWDMGQLARAVQLPANSCRPVLVA